MFVFIYLCVNMLLYCCSSASVYGLSIPGAAANASFSCLKKGHYYSISPKEDFSALKPQNTKKWINTRDNQCLSRPFYPLLMEAIRTNLAERQSHN